MPNNHHNHGHHHHHGHHSGGRDCVPCFARGTELRMADGSTKRVEDITVGDQLLTTSLEKGGSYVLWIGSSKTEEPLYGIYHPKLGAPVIVTGNHGLLVEMLDGPEMLAAAKFMETTEHDTYGDFSYVKECRATETDVFHIMFTEHTILETSYGLLSESYFCGGWEIIPEAQEALRKATGKEKHEDTILPRVKRRDSDQILSLVVSDI